ncbi:MAG: glycosyltransferase family 4 protein [Chitinophagaceae bacterium]
MIQVVHFQRKKREQGNHSIESYFSTIRELQPSDINITTKISKYLSNGIWRRICDTIEAVFYQKDINHITGDIHFVGTLLTKKKNILTIHDCGSLKRLSGIRFKIIKFFWYTLPASRSNIITVNSNATKQDLLSYINFPAEKIKVIHIFVPIIHQPFLKQFNSQKPIILQLGTAHNKNIHRVAQALKDISCKYLILGKLDAETTNVLNENNIDFENIDKSISDEDVAKLYQQCDIVSFASTLEGFGMPIIEANATGRVVVTSNVASMPEIGANAVEYVNPFDVQSIRNGFLKVINDSNYREALIQNGFENVKRFDKKKIANQYFDLYRSLVNTQKD